MSLADPLQRSPGRLAWTTGIRPRAVICRPASAFRRGAAGSRPRNRSRRA